MKPILIIIAFIAVFSLAKAQQTNTTKQIYSKVEKDPTPSGGWQEFYQYLRANKKYPKSAIEKNQEGEISISFVVEKNGSLADVKVSEGVSPELDAEAVRLVSACPKWNPGIQNGQIVRVRRSTVIYFDLPSSLIAARKAGQQKMDSLHNLPDEQKIYSATQQLPAFPGGMGKLYQYLLENIKYPDVAMKNGIEGKVFLSFVVEKDGSLSDITVLRGVSPKIDVEAIRLMKECPKWIPGMQNGQPVRVRYSIPVSFELK